MKKILAQIISITIIFVLGVSLVSAQQQTGGGSPTTGGGNPTTGGGNPTRPVPLENPFKGGNSLMELLQTIVDDILLPIGGIIAVLAFIWTGFMYVKARGNPKELETAHNSLLYTSIGTAILLGAWTIAKVIGNTIDQIKSAV